MIWNHQDRLPPVGESLPEHLASELIKSAGGAHGVEHVDEIAKAVAAYCAEANPDTCVPSDYLSVLLCRALRAAGHPEAAMRLADSRREKSVRDEVFEKMFHLEGFSPEIWRVFSSLLLRPVRWVSSGDQVVWVLDFARLSMTDAHCFELSFYRGLRLLLEGVAEIWDASGGEGVLGLRGARRAAGSLRAGAGRQAAGGEAEIVEYSGGVLAGLAERRGWKACPRVVSLDVLPRGRRVEK